MNSAGSFLVRAALPALWLCSLQAGAQAIPPEFQVNTTTNSHQFDSAVSALADGGFVVAWHDANSSTAKAQRFTSAGTKVGVMGTSVAKRVPSGSSAVVSLPAFGCSPWCSRAVKAPRGRLCSTLCP